MAKLPEYFFLSLWHSLCIIVFLSMCILVTLFFLFIISTGQTSLFDASILELTTLICLYSGLFNSIMISALSIPLCLFRLWRMTRAWMSVPWKAGMIGAGSSFVIFGLMLVPRAVSSHGPDSFSQRDFLMILCAMLAIVALSFSHSFLTTFLHDKQIKKQAAKLAMSGGL